MPYQITKLAIASLMLVLAVGMKPARADRELKDLLHYYWQHPVEICEGGFVSNAVLLLEECEIRGVQDLNGADGTGENKVIHAVCKIPNSPDPYKERMIYCGGNY